MTLVVFYSSERIENGEPISIEDDSSYYNQYIGDGYESKFVFESNNLEEFTLLCDEMEEPFIFKFVD